MVIQELQKIKKKIEKGNERHKILCKLGNLSYIDFVQTESNLKAETCYNTLGEVISDIAYYFCVWKFEQTPYNTISAAFGRTLLKSLR